MKSMVRCDNASYCCSFYLKNHTHYSDNIDFNAIWNGYFRTSKTICTSSMTSHIGVWEWLISVYIINWATDDIHGFSKTSLVFWLAFLFLDCFGMENNVQSPSDPFVGCPPYRSKCKNDTLLASSLRTMINKFSRIKCEYEINRNCNATEIFLFFLVHCYRVS